MKNSANLKQKYRSHFAFCKKSVLCFVSVALVACIFLSGCHATIPKTEPLDENDSTASEIGQQRFEEPMPENSYEDLGFAEEKSVYITLDSMSCDENGNTLLNVTWHNDTDLEVTFGAVYDIQYLNGDEWVNTAFTSNFFHMRETCLKPNTVSQHSYTTRPFDTSKIGTYRLIVPFSLKDGDCSETWVEFQIVTPGLDASAFFDNPQEIVLSIDYSDKLDVYVYQMAANNYNFIILPHSEAPRSLLDLLQYTPMRGGSYSMSLQEVQELFADYNIEKDQVYMIPYQHPLSSYITDFSMIIEGENIAEKRMAYLDSIYDMIFEIETNN